MQFEPATALAHPNIAFIKYWGNQNHDLRIPVNGSISMNLEGLQTQTTVHFDEQFNTDSLLLNGEVANPKALERVNRFLDWVRELAGIRSRASVESENNFPMGSGIASSASAFAALALAASQAAGLDLDEKALSILARKGSGSASRSIPGGFVEWQAGNQDADSFAESIAPPNHWDLVDCITIVNEEHKETGSSAGHPLAESSPLQIARVAGADQRLAAVRTAIIERDFAQFAATVEQDSLLMHAVMMTSSPSLLYWTPASVRILQACRGWQEHGTPLATTMDAGPNVHVLTMAEHAEELAALLAKIDGVKRVIVARPGGGAKLLGS